MGGDTLKVLGILGSRTARVLQRRKEEREAEREGERQAVIAIQEGERAAEAEAERSRRIVAAQRAGFGATGFAFQGTPTFVTSDTIEESIEQRRIIRDEANLRGRLAIRRARQRVQRLSDLQTLEIFAGISDLAQVESVAEGFEQRAVEPTRRGIGRLGRGVGSFLGGGRRQRQQGSGRAGRSLIAGAFIGKPLIKSTGGGQ